MSECASNDRREGSRRNGAVLGIRDDMVPSKLSDIADLVVQALLEFTGQPP
jgi:hypothetical protein